MIPRLRVTLEGGDGPVEVITRPVDLFAAEEAVGFDPLGELTAASTVGTVSTRVLRGLVALAWAGYNRTHGGALSLEDFTAQLVEVPTVADPDDDEAGVDARPTLAAASTG
jgi:hypothetical protein